MDLFEVLFGGNARRPEYEDFARRYDEGPPWDGYSDREVLDRYGEVAHKLPPEEYEAATREALSRLSPAQQADLGRHLLERAAARGVALPDARPAAAPGGGLDGLARSVRELHEQPGRLRDLLGTPGGGAGSPVPGGAGARASGVPADAGSIFGSPLAKAAIAGITAMLVRRMLAPR